MIEALAATQKACDSKVRERLEKQWDLANVYDEGRKKKKKGVLELLSNGTTSDGLCRTGKKGRSFRISKL